MSGGTVTTLYCMCCVNIATCVGTATTLYCTVYAVLCYHCKLSITHILAACCSCPCVVYCMHIMLLACCVLLAHLFAYSAFELHSVCISIFPVCHSYFFIAQSHIYVTHCIYLLLTVCCSSFCVP